MASVAPPVPLSRQLRRTRKSRTELGGLGLIGDEAFLIGLFPLPAQRVGARGDPRVGVLRVGDVCGLGAFQEPDVLPADACRSEERSARLPGEQPVLVAAVQRVDHCDPVRWHRGALAAATVWVGGDDEQVTLRLETGMDRDLQVAIEVIKHVEAVLVDELAERCCGHTGSSQWRSLTMLLTGLTDRVLAGGFPCGSCGQRPRTGRPLLMLYVRLTIPAYSCLPRP